MSDTGVVDTGSIHSWEHPRSDNHLSVAFTAPFPSPPPVLMGLKSLDIGRQSNPRITCEAHDVRSNGLTINLKSWASTVQYSSACSWFVPSITDPDLQHGHFSTTEDHPWHKPQPETTRHITFARSYAAAPKVIVWLCHLDVDKDRNYRVRVYATDVTQRGFKLHINSWAGTKLYGARAYWLAYSGDRKDICGGTFGTGDIRRWDEPRSANFNTLFFKNADFSQPPRIFLAFNSLDIDCRHNLRVRVYANPIMSAGMIWHIDSWADTILYSACVLHSHSLKQLTRYSSVGFYVRLSVYMRPRVS